ncbi:hypothetical protein JHK85_030747 [Glycine max]|nr:hypothetical protein JHK85_030747 [Glycine max]
MKGNMLTPYPFLISCNGLLPSDIWGILKEDPAYPEALIGRGTAYAFKRELDAAMADFSKAIEFNPSAGEAWKRRGQARAALGGVCGGEGIANFKFKEFDAAVEDLSACVQLGRDNESAYTCLKSEEAHLKSLQIDRNFLEAWEHLTQGELGFDFAIRTPCTPARWEDYDAEMPMAWECTEYLPLAGTITIQQYHA